MKIRLLFTVARGYTDKTAMRSVVEQVHAARPNAVLVHGDCPEGDQDVAAIWRELGGIDEPRPADWYGPCRPQCRPRHRRIKDGKEYCPAAGPYRNHEMFGPEPIQETHALVATGSRGARDTAEMSTRLGIPTFTWPLGAGAVTVPPYRADRFSCEIAVFCDTCEHEERGDYLVHENDSENRRFGYARAYLRTQGWHCDKSGDFCPHHKPRQLSLEDA
ncbi:hypothetical protein [Lentzea sp. NPDC092896]|uniref:hypothetical protein n=1 Tax=Lentzea sp. NPDC092896 TaxID=3364127 RepID=UPI0037F5924A